MGFLRWVCWRAAAARAKHSQIASSFASPCVPFAQTAQPQAAAPRAAPTPVSVPRFESAGSPAKEAASARGLEARWLFIGMHPACLASAGGPSLALCMHKADDDDSAGCDPRAAAKIDDAGKETAAQILRAQLETKSTELMHGLSYQDADGTSVKRDADGEAAASSSAPSTAGSKRR